MVVRLWEWELPSLLLLLLLSWATEIDFELSPGAALLSPEVQSRRTVPAICSETASVPSKLSWADFLPAG
jgi:hypothetical protein